MQKKLRIYLTNFWPTIILLLISSILAILNITPGTWLSGWDTLHPEFNFGLNLERLINGVFRMEQGLGAVAAHSHMADLPRVLFLYLESFILPDNLLRYSWIFLNLIAGPIGMYLFLNRSVFLNKHVAFLGALFYLLNIGTVQIFNVPFEMFTTLYATLPFVFYTGTRFLANEGNKYKNLFLFSVSIIFTAPAAYAATLWYAFFATFLLYIFIFWFTHRRAEKRNLLPTKPLILVLITLALNLFWIGPNIYFLLNHASAVQNANINLLFSESAFLKNKAMGDLGSLFFLKTFYFDWFIYNGSEFVDLLRPYIDHLSDLKFQMLGIIINASWVLGLFYLIKIKKANIFVFIAPFLLTLFFMLNSNFPTAPLFDFLQTQFPFFKEAFRFPQNKFLNEYVFFVSIFFGYFSYWLIQKTKKPLIVTFILSLVLIIYALPSFQGNLINKLVRVDIPKNYFSLFEYLETQPETARVSNLPIHSQWGWVYYKWGFQGAGFLYFGIRQPLLDRDFDRWSPYNESYYREASYAVYKKDASLLKEVFDKYNLGFVFIDKEVFEPNQLEESLFLEESEKLIEETGLITETKTFGSIKLFKLTTSKDEFYRISQADVISPSANSTYSDFAKLSLGNYILNSNASLYFPFRNLVDNQGRLSSKNVVFETDRIRFDVGELIKNEGASFQRTDTPTTANVIIDKTPSSIDLSLYPASAVLDTQTTSVPLNTSLSSSSQYISINRKELFELSKFSLNTPTVAGNLLLEKTNSVSTFNEIDLRASENVTQAINPFFENCDGKAPPRAEFSGNKITLTGKGSICILIPYGFFPQVDSEALTNFGFNYVSDSSPISCLFDQRNSTCKVFKDPTTSGGNLVNFLYVLEPLGAGNTAIKIFFEAPDEKENKIEISNFFASLAPSRQTILLERPTPNLKSVSFKNIYIPREPLNDTEAIFRNKTENDCTVKRDNTKKELINENGTSIVKYTSIEGRFCDHFSYPNLPHDLAYFVVVESKNEKGLPLNLCISNYTSRKCDIYTSLSKGVAYKKDIFILPPTDSGAIGYDINFENPSVAKTPAVNYVSSIEFIPFPYDAVSSVNIGTPTQERNILALNSSYERGFRAFAIEHSDNQIVNRIKESLPFIFGRELDKHVLVNNWSNGWLVSKETDEQSKIKVVFLPQYLEWLGLILLLVTITVLPLKWLRK
jgi:hypothetical protein